MKIGIITFHKAINAGANLQAYALQAYLSKKGYDAELIDYIPHSEIDRRSWKRKVLHYIKGIISPSIRRSKRIGKKYSQFQKNYMKISETRFLGDFSIKNKELKYDVIISGSDQILNLKLSDYSFAYYLPFNDKTYKFSYASSFGRTDVCDVEKWAILNYLSKFKHLSFREETGFLIANELLKIPEKNIVVDPCFLLEKNEWRLLLTKQKHSEPYILAYVMDANEQIKKTIEIISNNNPGIKVIVLLGTNSNFELDKSFKRIYGASPLEFLNLVDNAKIVITNSFHGLVFSLIFEKNFYCCSHSTKNDRLVNLMKAINEEDKVLNQNSKQPICVDGKKKYMSLLNQIDFSRQYICKCIEEANND